MAKSKYILLGILFFHAIILIACKGKNVDFIDRELYFSMNFKQFLTYTLDNINEECIKDNKGNIIPLELRLSFYSTIPFNDLIIKDNWKLNAKFFYIKIKKDLTMTAYFKHNDINRQIKYAKNDFNKYYAIIEHYMKNETGIEFLSL